MTDPAEAFDPDPAEPFEALRGSLNRSLTDAIPPIERWTRRPSYDDLAISAIPRAAAFSTDYDLASSPELIAEFMRHELATALQELTAFAFPNGRDRNSGNWAAVNLFYTATGLTSAQKFYTDWRRIVFPICGFGDWIPTYNEMAERLRELKTAWQGFAEVVGMLVAIVHKRINDLGLFAWVDSTAFLSPCRVEHACQDLEACKRAGGGDAAPWSIGSAKDVERARAAEAEYELPDPNAGPDRTRRDIVWFKRPSGRLVGYRLVWANGHWGRSLDLTAGFRRYDNKASWWGGLAPTIAVAPFGLPIAVCPIPADIQEWDAYPHLYALACKILGHPPAIMSCDRGYAHTAFYLFNTYRKVATVGPRKKKPGVTDDDRTTWRHPGGLFDEDGIPRCEVCKGPGIQDEPRFGLYNQIALQPRIGFRCLAQPYPACRSDQSIACDVDPVSLVPLSRVHPLYADVRYIHHNREGVFRHERTRSSFCGKDTSSRLNAPGVEAQRLRCWAALLLDWFRLALRHGYLDAIGLDVQINPDTPVRLSSVVEPRTRLIKVAGVGAADHARRLDARYQNDTDLPFEGA